MLYRAGTLFLSAVTLLVQGVAPSPVAAEQPPDKPSQSLKLADVCRLAVEDGGIVIYANLPAGGFNVGQRGNVQVADLPGTTSLAVAPGFYQMRNSRTDGASFSIVTVYSMPTQTSIESTMRGGSKSQTISLYQAGGLRGRGDLSPGEIRLTVYGEGVPGGNMNFTAANFTALRREHPVEVNRFLRPMLDLLRADLLKVEPIVARQVLIGGAPAEGVAAEARALAAQLDAAAYTAREAAAKRLRELGPAAAQVLRGLDAGKLSDQQMVAIGAILATPTLLTPREVEQLRADVHFLLDCLYCEDPTLRAAAVERLRTITGKSIAFDAHAVGERGAEIEAIRARVAPAGR